MSERIPPVDLSQGARVMAMIGNVFCARAIVVMDVNWMWVAQPTKRAYGEIALQSRSLLPWRYLTAGDEGLYWIRGWYAHNSRIVRALKVAAAIALAQQQA